MCPKTDTMTSNSGMKNDGCVSEKDLTIGFAKTPPNFFSESKVSTKQSSGVWDRIHMIRRAGTGDLVPNWYMCQVIGCPKPFLNCILANGNSKLSRHLDSHSKIVQPYSLKPSDLYEALSLASELGAKYGKINAEYFEKYAPNVQENWSANFVNEIGLLMSQNELPTTSSSSSSSAICPSTTPTVTIIDPVNTSSTISIQNHSCSNQMQQIAPTASIGATVRLGGIHCEYIINLKK